MIKKPWLTVILAFCLAGIVLYVAEHNSSPVERLLDGRFVTAVEERTIEIPGLENTYHFLFLADMHILVLSDEVAESERDMMQNRRLEFSSNGHDSAEIFGQIVKNANKAKPDGVLLGGDIIDYLSLANVECLNENLSRLKMPYLFVTADHDMSCWWTDYSEEEQDQLREKLNYEPVQVMDYDEFLVVGISGNTSQLQEDALERIREVFALGKPVILVQHVPLASVVDEDLRHKSEKMWDGRALLWGDDCSYDANETTQEFLDMVHAPDSPVVAILAGHLHFEQEGMVNDHVKQFLFNPAYTGEVAYITVKSTAQ